MFDLLIHLSLDQCGNICYNAFMGTFNSFEELVQSTQNQPLDVSSNPNGTVTSGAVQPPASIPPAGSEGNPPGWHNSLAQKVTGIDQRLTNLDQKVTGIDGRLTTLEKKVDDGFAKVDKGFGIIEQMRTGMNQKFSQIDQQFTNINQQFTQVGQSLEEIKTRLPQK
jgi:peptidoglycan hydrolase CwlO-like protein